MIYYQLYIYIQITYIELYSVIYIGHQEIINRQDFPLQCVNMIRYDTVNCTIQLLHKNPSEIT